MTCALYGAGQLALELRGYVRDATGQDLALLVQEALERLRVFVVDVIRLDKGGLVRHDAYASSVVSAASAASASAARFVFVAS